MPWSQPKSPKKLKDIQRLAAAAIRTPLGRGDRTRSNFLDGRPMKQVVESFIKPNDRLTSLERLEIYNRQYWFRVLDCLYDDYPGLRAILGLEKFHRICRAYLEQYPSRSFSLRNLGDRLEKFLIEQPQLTAPRTEMAIDMARFEWAQIVAFDGPANEPLSIDDLLGADPVKLRLSLQPHLTLLDMGYPLDDFVIAVKKKNAAMRSEASNAVENPSHHAREKKLRLPRRKRLLLAVHRWDNGIYYKHLEPAEHAILLALRDGKSVVRACERGAQADANLSGEQVQKWFKAWAQLGWLCAHRKQPRKSQLMLFTPIR
jgi:Putative DNA-binding domain